jgi:hypothetical protein
LVLTDEPEDRWRYLGFEQIIDDMDRAEPDRFPHPRLFKSPSEWFDHVRKEGFSVPVQAPWAISRAMKEFDIAHAEAFDWLVDRGLIAIRGGVLVVDIRATQVDLRTIEDSGQNSY